MVLSRVPSVSSPFVIRDVLQTALQNVCSDSCPRPTRGHASCVTGGSDSTNFGRIDRRKVGSLPLPPDLVFLSASLCSLSSRLFLRIPENSTHHNVKKSLKTKLKREIFTLFTCSGRNLASHASQTRHERIPGATRWAGATATGSVATKWGRSSPTRCHAAAI